MSKNPSKSSSVQKDFVKLNKEQASQAKSKNLNKSIESTAKQPYSLSVSKITLNSINTAKINPQKKRQEPQTKIIPTTVVESFQILNDPELILKRERLSQTTEALREKCEKVITPVKNSLTPEEQVRNPEFSLEKIQDIFVQASQSSKKSKNLEEEKTKDDENNDANYQNTAKESQEINDIYYALDEKAVENYRKSLSENLLVQLHSIEEDTGSSKYYSPETSPKFNEEAGGDYMEVEDDEKSLHVQNEKPFEIVYQHENLCSFGNPQSVFIQNQMVDEQGKLDDDRRKVEEFGKSYGFEKVMGDDDNKGVMRRDIEKEKDSRKSVGKVEEEEMKDVRMEGYDEELIGKMIEKNDEVNADMKIPCVGIPETSKQYLPTYADSNSRRHSIMDTLIKIQRKSENPNENSPKKPSLSPAFKVIDKSFGSQTKTNPDNMEKKDDMNLNYDIFSKSAKNDDFPTVEDNEKFDKPKELDDEAPKSQRSPIIKTQTYSFSTENKSPVSKRPSETSNYLNKNEKSSAKSTQGSQKNLNLNETNSKSSLEMQDKSKKASINSISEENEDSPDFKKPRESNIISSKSISNKKSAKNSEVFTENSMSESESEEQNKGKINKSNKQSKKSEQKKAQKAKFEEDAIKDQKIEDGSIENSKESSLIESSVDEESEENDSKGYENEQKLEAKKYMTRKRSKFGNKDQEKREKSQNRGDDKKAPNRKKEMIPKDKKKGKSKEKEKEIEIEIEKEKKKLAPPKVAYEELEGSETNIIRRSERLAKIKQLKEIREAEMQLVKRRPRSKKAGYRKRLKE